MDKTLERMKAEVEAIEWPAIGPANRGPRNGFRGDNPVDKMVGNEYAKHRGKRTSTTQVPT